MIVHIVGNLGAGKSTLASLLAQRLGWQALLETIEDIPYFNEFYSDMSRWSFHQQVAFLLADLRVQQDKLEAYLSDPTKPVVQDWIFDIHWIYAQAFVIQGWLSERDYMLYKELCDRTKRYLHQPSHVIFLDVSPKKALERILHRARPAEQAIDLPYVELLDQLVRSFLADYQQCPVLHVAADSLDYVNNEQDKQRIVQQVQTFCQVN